MERRELLRLAVAGASSLWLPRSAQSQTRFNSSPFTLGIASGSPTSESVVLWTRLLVPVATDAAWEREPVAVQWEVAHDDQFVRIVQSGRAMALPELAHSVHAEVSGLEPDRWYF